MLQPLRLGFAEPPPLGGEALCRLLLDLLPISLGGLFGFVVAVGVVGAVFDDVGEVLLADPVVGEIVGSAGSETG